MAHTSVHGGIMAMKTNPADGTQVIRAAASTLMWMLPHSYISAPSTMSGVQSEESRLTIA